MSTPNHPFHADEGVRSTASRRFRLAYLTTEYPKVSHTFIRREILELEKRGHYVLRLAIRSAGGAIADEADRQEQQRTFHCLSQPRLSMLLALLLVIVTRPVRFARALRVALQMHRRSERGFFTHLAYLAEAALLLRVLIRDRIDHVHVHFGTNSAAVARLIRALGGPSFSITIHGPDEFDAPYGFSLREKIVESAFTVAISGYCAAQLRRWAPHEQWKKIHIVRCTVGHQFFDVDAPIPHDSNTFLCVGRLTPQKGHFLLIEAMHVLRNQGADARLILAGDGEIRSEVESQIAAFKLQDRVTITGWVDERQVRDLLARCRVLVQPSFAEGLPVVIMEAMAMGRPIISTAIAGIPELVQTGRTGWLIGAGDVQQLTDVMKQALNAPVDQLVVMGQCAREMVRNRHSTHTEVDELERLFETYIARAPRDAKVREPSGREVRQPVTAS